MKIFRSLLAILVIGQFICFPLKTNARPGEAVDNVLKRYDIEGQQPVTQEDYVSYKVNDTKFVSKPTLFLKLGSNGIVLEENFLFDKNTVHEKDVHRSKIDTRPTAAIPHSAYLVGDFSQLPREQFDTRSRTIGAFAAPLGAAVGTFTGAGKGLYEGTKIGIKTADSASRALGGDASGKAGAWAASATAVATGAITGLFAGFTGGVVEGSVRGSRVALEGISGADRQITEATQSTSNYVIIGGRIGKELSPEEQKSLLDKLAQLEQSRLASEGLDVGKDIANLGDDSDSKSIKKAFDSASDRSGFEGDTNYQAEEGSNKNVAGLW